VRAVSRALQLAALAVIAAGTSCSSSSAAPSTFTDIYPLIFPQTTKAQCNFCHSLPPNDKSNGNLSMGSDKAAAYAALTSGKTSTSTTCPNKAFIVAGQPDQSLFYVKLTSPQCGGRMPLGGDPLTSAQLDMVKSWIEAGAKDD
jgi:hypothetical protein